MPTETHTPRVDTPARHAFLRMHAATVMRHTHPRTGNVSLPKWRERTLYDLSGCGHASRETCEGVEVCTNCGRAVGGLKPKDGCKHSCGTLFEVHNAHGTWGIIICAEDDCGGIQSGPQCPHVSNTWNADGTALTCDNCGIDGT